MQVTTKKSTSKPLSRFLFKEPLTFTQNKEASKVQIF